MGRRINWNDNEQQTFNTNLEWYEQLFEHLSMGVVLGDTTVGDKAFSNGDKKEYTTKAVFHILARWFNVPQERWSTILHSGYSDESLGTRFEWNKMSHELNIALAGAVEEEEFNPYQPGPYKAYDVFRILYRLKFGEWLGSQEDVEVALEKFGSVSMHVGPVVEHQGQCAGAPTDGPAPAPAPKVPKASDAGVFSAIAMMGNKSDGRPPR